MQARPPHWPKETEQQNNQAAPPENANSTEQFLNEAKQPTIDAMDGPGFAPPPPGNAPEGSQAYTPPEGAQPIFERGDEAGGADTAPTKPLAEERSEDYKRTILRGYINTEDKLTSTIYAMIAKVEDDTGFRATDEDIDDLITCLEPYKDMIVNALPAWIPVLTVYVMMKIKQFQRFRKVYATQKDNEKAKDDQHTMSRIGRVYSSREKRTNFVLYIDGYYRNSPTGQYIKRIEENKKLLERPSIKDIDQILAVKANRERDLLAKAFGWEDDDFKKHGIE